MKLVANLIVVTSMFLSQFSGPYAPQTVPPQSTLTATATATAVPIPTETTTALPPSETPTPAPSETITPAPSSTEVPPVETVPPLGPIEPIIAINLSTTPGFVTPGGHIKVDWKLEGISVADHVLFLNIILPKGFTPLDKDVTFDEASLTLSFPADKDSGHFRLQAPDQFTEDAELLAFLLEKDTILAKSPLLLGSKDQFNLTSQGGEIQDASGKIKLTFPADTFAGDAVVQIGEPSGDEVPTSSLSGHPFSIKTQDKNSKADLHQFDKEIEIKVNYSDFNIPEGQEGDLDLYWYNPQEKLWELMLTTHDKETDTLTTTTTHFSVFDVGLNSWQASHVPTVDAFQVSEFTGAGTYTFPIAVPPGPGGLQPNLALSYNSQIIDQSTTAVQASWVGMGWSLETGSIERDMNGTVNDLTDDTFLLNVAGVSTRLIQDAGGIYHPSDENFWKIDFVNANNAWTVWDKQGNAYNFAAVFNTVSRIDCYNSSSPGGYNTLTSQWLLTSIRNVFNQEISYTYSREQKQYFYHQFSTALNKCKAYEITPDSAIYPNTISYAGGKYRIRFELEGGRTDYLYTSPNFQLSRLNNIYVESQNSSGAFDLVRRYDLEYVSPTNTSNLIYPGFTYSLGGKMTTLEKITQFGTDNVSSLPPITFTYGDNLHLTHANNGYGGGIQYTYQPWYYAADGPRSGTKVFDYSQAYNSPCRGESPAPWTARSGGVVDCQMNTNIADYLRIIGTAQNHDGNTFPFAHARPGGFYKLSLAFAPEFSGQVATVKLGIEDGNQDIMSEINVASGAPVYLLLPSTAKTAFPVIQVTGAKIIVTRFNFQAVPTFYRVTQKTISSGKPGENYSVDYSFIDPAVNDTGHSITACSYSSPSDSCNAYVETFSEFRGHGQVIVSGPDGKITTTTFAQDDARKGQVDKIIVRDANGLKLQETIFTAATTSLYMPPLSYSWGFGHYWVRPSATVSRAYALDGTFQATRTVYTFDPAYGNLTAQTENSWADPNWVTYRTTQTDYFPNTSNYLVGLPARQYIMDANNGVIAETLNIYDNNPGYNQSPTSGILKKVRTWVKGTQGTGDYRQADYGYDTWGNQTTVTTYSGYGTASAAPTVGAQTSYTCYGSGEALNGEVCADDGYRTYPLWSKNALGQKTSLIYDYRFGLPLIETDPNNAQTRAEYDVFGRMTNLFRPAPASGAPIVSASLRMTYSNSYPFTTSITQRVDPSDTYTTYTVTRVYDGMGRQTKSINYPGPAVTDINQIVNGVYTETEYQSATTTRQSLPHYANETPQFTTTANNLDARTVTVTAPDGTSTITTSNGLITTARDARGNITTTTADVWGRTVSVVPPTGPALRYVYDPLGRMTYALRGLAASINSQTCFSAPSGANCPSSTITSLSYNAGGQKTGMTDPDMGAWSYEYDALGNLTRQTDARSCELIMGYDLLNRVTSKSSTGVGCGTQVSASYFYDVGTNGKGRRTSMTDASGSTSWTYDKRGRMLSETKTIAGVAYATQWVYNQADLVINTTYPDGEVVTNTYDQMRLSSLSGVKNSVTTTYIQSSAYDSASRLTDRTLGNGLAQKFIYPAWTSQGGRLDKIIAGSGAWNAVTETFATSTLQKLDYAYDPAGNIKQIFNPLVNETQIFNYDSLDRLTNAQASGAAEGAYTEAYNYDPNTGNLAAKGGSAATPGNPGLNGLVSWWSMDETSGIRSDSYGGNHLSDNNTVTSAVGKKGSAASFASANSEYLLVNDNPSISGGDVDFTLIANVYLNDTTTTAIIANKANDIDAYDYRLIYVANTGFRLRVSTNSSAVTVTSDPVLPNTWYTVFAWHDSVNNTINIQVDNGAVKTTAFSSGTMDSTAPLSIGARADGTWGLNGRIDEFAMYKRVLTGGERDWLYNSGQGRAYTELINYLYTYSPAHPHAVTSLSLGNTYQYDANGNMIQRFADGKRYAMAYDAENRMVKVCEDTSNNALCDTGEVVTATFVYDGDGRRVKSEAYANGVLTETILFIGSHYEVTNPGSGQIVTKYYFAGTSHVAMRKYTIPSSMTVEYFLNDHLGSTSITVDSSGAKASEIRYKAWGEIRYSWKATQTTTPAYKLPLYTFTGQASYMDDPTTSGVTEGFGVMFYQSRFYDPALGRFAQADSIIPPGVQGLDRYAFVYNNPLKYTDPSGHDPSNNNCDYAGVGCKPAPIITRPPNPFHNPNNSDWYSGKYSGCFMCHAAVANGKTILTNSELATSFSNATTAQGYEASVMVASMAVGTVVGLSLPAATTGAGACASNAECLDVADDAFVKFDPTKYDSSIDEMGLLTEFSKDGRTWLTQFKYAKDIINSQDLDTILYRKELWVDMAGKFADGATLRLVNISGATPAGVTNMTNGIPQWYVTFDISSDALQVIWRLP